MTQPALSGDWRYPVILTIFLTLLMLYFHVQMIKCRKHIDPSMLLPTCTVAVTVTVTVTGSYSVLLVISDWPSRGQGEHGVRTR